MLPYFVEDVLVGLVLEINASVVPLSLWCRHTEFVCVKRSLPLLCQVGLRCV
jgi:hypothetical protein